MEKGHWELEISPDGLLDASTLPAQYSVPRATGLPQQWESKQSARLTDRTRRKREGRRWDFPSARPGLAQSPTGLRASVRSWQPEAISKALCTHSPSPSRPSVGPSALLFQGNPPQYPTLRLPPLLEHDHTAGSAGQQGHGAGAFSDRSSPHLTEKCSICSSLKPKTSSVSL